MASLNSTPDHAQNSPMDDQDDNSSSHGTDPVTEASPCIDDIHKIVVDFKRNSRLSLIHSESSSTVITDASVHDQSDNSSPIEAELYMFLVNGNKDEILNMGVNLWELKCKEYNNSVLHIAACAGQTQLIIDILPLCKDIIKWKNSKGDLAFHCAAKSLQLDALKALIDWEKYDIEAGISSALLKEGNRVGDIALHIALENNDEEMALYLVNQCPQACYRMNKKRVSPLYMAIELGYQKLVKKMIHYTKLLKPASDDALMSGKSVVHAAIEAESIDILKEILDNHGKLIDSLDDESQTPLSYASFKGYLDVVRYLLKKFPHFANKCNEDEDGSFPIHKAASGGHIKVIKELHTTKQLLNKRDQNILHVASTNGKAEVVSYLLKIQELEKFINLKDEDGNTPLHLASKGLHPRVVYVLTREPRTKHELRNKVGLTALDLVEIHAESPQTFEARLTWMGLRYVNAPRSSQSTRIRYLQNVKPIGQEQEFPDYCNGSPSRKANDKSELESFKSRVDTFLLVATLVATVTFAAGFTAPGGYKQDDPDIGTAVLTYKWAFQVFIICDTAALYSSVLSVVSLIWAHMGDHKLILVSLKFALPLLGFALTMMSLAFMMGIFVVLRTLPWLSYVVLGMGSLFLLVVLVLFIPLHTPSCIRNPVVRFFFTGPFLLLLLVCEKSTIKYT